MNAELFRKLAALGLSTEQIAGVLEIMDSEAEERKEKGRARWRKWKENQPTNVSKRLPTTANVSSQLARADITSKEDISKEEKKEYAAPSARVSLDGFKAQLSSILDSERIDALIALRRKKGAPLTEHAGRLLSKALLSCPNANEAADEMVLRNWTSVKPEWMEKRQSRSAPSRKPNPFDAYNELALERGWIDEPEVLPSNNGNVELLPPEHSGHPSAVVDFRGGIAGRIRSRNH